MSRQGREASLRVPRRGILLNASWGGRRSTSHQTGCWVFYHNSARIFQAAGSWNSDFSMAYAWTGRGGSRPTTWAEFDHRHLLAHWVTPWRNQLLEETIKSPITLLQVPLVTQGVSAPTTRDQCGLGKINGFRSKWVLIDLMGLCCLSTRLNDRI